MLPRPARLLALAGLAWLAAAASGQAERGDGLAELVARDARLSFGADAAARARAVLEAAPEDPEERALAAVALGCARARAERARLESMLADGKKVEQRAALFALGELGDEGLVPLAAVRATDGLEAALAVSLVVAELRGAAAAGAELERLAQGDDARAASARLALEWRAGGAPGALEPALELYYGLRWRAAREYGLVDGARWQKSVAARLFADEGFLERAILGAAVELPLPELEAHLTELLLAGESPPALRAAVRVMPEDLAQAVQAGVFQPSVAAWRVLLGAIEDERSERRARKLVELAFRAAPELEPLAGLLIFRAGGDLPWVWVGNQLEKGEPAQRVALVEACGDRGEKARIPDLADLLERRKDLGVLGPGLVALARLGHPSAKEALDGFVKAPASPERDEVLQALARVLHDPALRRPAQAALELADLPPDVHLALELGLALSGVKVERGKLRALLAQAPRGAKRLALVRALGERPESADLAALAALFPDEDDLELDVELTRVLLRARHPSMTGLLTAGLWSAEWNRSVLAGGLIVRSGGTRTLLDEIDAAPRTARETDLRRAGFALGEWGGLPAVEELARTRGEGDAVLQGALLGALASRAGQPDMPARPVRLPGEGAGEGAAAGAEAAAGGGKPAGKRAGPRKGKKRH